MSTFDMSYVLRWKYCGCICAAAVISANHVAGTAKNVNKWRKYDDCEISIEPTADVRSGHWHGPGECDKPVPAAPAGAVNE